MIVPLDVKIRGWRLYIEVPDHFDRHNVEFQQEMSARIIRNLIEQHEIKVEEEIEKNPKTD